MTTFQRIDMLRKNKGITLSFLNDKIGGYRGKLTEVKNDKTTLTVDELKIIAEELDTTVDYLLGTTDDPSPQKEKTAQKQDGLTKKQQEAVNYIRSLSDSDLDKLIKMAKVYVDDSAS